MQLFTQAVPIWSISKNELSDQYRIFRKIFQIDCIDQPVFLNIAADTTFCATVNGTRLPLQQLADFRGDITVSKYDISKYLICGENIISCEVHFVGANFSTCFAGTAFLCAEIYDKKHVFAATDESWKCAVSPDMQSGLNCRVTLQLGFVFCKDARKSISWESINFDDSEWQNAVKVENCSNWKGNLRKVPQLVELPKPKSQCISQFGYLLRKKEESSFALTAFHDFLSPRRPEEFFELDLPSPIDRIHHKENEDLIFKPLSDNADGYYIIIDTGCECVGYLFIDITAPEGTVIDICHGEHLEDGRVRTHIGGRNFADRLITKEGRNQLFYNHRRVGLRYMELHITNSPEGRIILHYAGVIPLELPLPQQSEFVCDDLLIQKINELSCNTLKLCMHEHYEDCPWREQALYGYDSRNQMLYGYYVWGNYDFARVSLDLLGKSFDGKDYIELIAPGDAGLTIPIFTMVWITALYEHHLFSGDSELTVKYINVIDTILNSAFSRTMEDAPGLCHTGSGKKIWNFCEWNKNLAKLDEHPQAAYNIYLCEAVNSAAKLHAMLGNCEREKYLLQHANKLAEAIEQKFYNREKHFYSASETTADECYEHIQQIMLANKMVPAEKIAALVDNIISGNFSPIDFSAFYYLISGMMKSGPAARKHLFQTLLNSFGPMVFSGATSLWETNNAFDKFGGAASLCHAWSSVMPYFCGHCILGVTPLEAGFKKFEVKPYPANLTKAAGSVPTPYGFISVSWRLTDSGMTVKIEHPENLECITSSYPECGDIKFEIIRAAVSSCAQEPVYPLTLK